MMSYILKRAPSFGHRNVTYRFGRKATYSLFMTHSGQDFPWLSKVLGVLGHSGIFFNVCGYNDLCSSKGQVEFWLRRPGALLGFWIGSFNARDTNMT
ncbi:hypothetical protein TNCV_4314381 [Trichonephila clavipes]|nr:hypothetical protein TNCV_4314381 [Trichonephila clavipes]